MRKALGALLALALAITGIVAGVPRVSAAGNYFVSVDDATATEGGPAQFAVFTTPTRPAPGDTVTVQVNTTDGTAQGDTSCSVGDYLDHSQTVTLTNESPQQMVFVQTCDDLAQEPSENFTLQLSNPTANCGNTTPCSATVADGTGQGTITDNEPAPPSTRPSPSASPSPSPSPVPPGPPTLAAIDTRSTRPPCIFHVNRSGDASGTATVNFVSSGKSRLVTNVAGTLVFAPGETVAQILVDVARRPRRGGFVTLTLSDAAGATITDATGVCHIRGRRGKGRRGRRR